MENLFYGSLIAILLFISICALVEYRRKKKELEKWENEQRERNMRHWHEDLRRRFGGPAETPNSTMQIISSENSPSENV
jgi:hypothetical protein